MSREKIQDAYHGPRSDVTYFLVGDPEAGPNIVKVEVEEEGSWDERRWNARKLAIIGEYKGEEALISDGYLDGNTVIGASASRNEEGNGWKVCFWEYQLE